MPRQAGSWGIPVGVGQSQYLGRMQRPRRQCFHLILERETGIEPATNGLGSRYSTIELLPHPLKLYPAKARRLDPCPSWRRQARQPFWLPTFQASLSKERWIWVRWANPRLGFPGITCRPEPVEQALNGSSLLMMPGSCTKLTSTDRVQKIREQGRRNIPTTTVIGWSWGRAAIGGECQRMHANLGR